MIEVNKSLEYEKIEKMLEEYFSFEDSLEDFKKEEMIKDDFYLDREHKYLSELLDFFNQNQYKYKSEIKNGIYFFKKI